LLSGNRDAALEEALKDVYDAINNNEASFILKWASAVPFGSSSPRLGRGGPCSSFSVPAARGASCGRVPPFLPLGGSGDVDRDQQQDVVGPLNDN
jgi:hypothetical protein